MRTSSAPFVQYAPCTHPFVGKRILPSLLEYSPVRLLNQYGRVLFLLSLTSHASPPGLDFRASSRSLR
jgi:hypothetical protein